MFFDRESGVIRKIEYDTANGTPVLTDVCKAPYLCAFAMCKGDRLYCTFEDKNGIFVYDVKKTKELAHADIPDSRVCHIEIADDYLFAACGDSGCDVIFTLDNSGFLKNPVTVTHTSQSGSRNGRFAACNAMTSSPYRFASADNIDGTVTIMNIYPSGESVSVRECSRIKLGRRTDIRSMIFTQLDCCYILDRESRCIILCDFHAGSGTLWPMGEFTLPFSPLYMCISKDEKHIFVVDESKRVHVYEPDKSGMIK